MELATLDSQRAAGVHLLSLDGKQGLYARLGRNDGSGLFKHLAGGEGKRGLREQRQQKDGDNPAGEPQGTKGRETTAGEPQGIIIHYFHCDKRFSKDISSMMSTSRGFEP